MDEVELSNRSKSNSDFQPLNDEPDSSIEPAKSAKKSTSSAGSSAGVSEASIPKKFSIRPIEEEDDGEKAAGDDEQEEVGALTVEDSKAEPKKSLCQKFKDWVWDDLMTYETEKTVEVHDKCLGAINLLATIAIFLYVLIFVLGEKKAYLEVQPGFFSLTTNFLANQTDRPNPNDLSYCADPNPPEPPNRLLCEYRNENFAVYTGIDEQSIALTTAFSQSMLVYNETAREYSFTQQTQSYFIADVERYTLRIRHSVQAESFRGAQFRASSRDMIGTITADNGTVLFEVPQRDDDIFTLGFLLSVAGVNLDEMSDFPGAESESMRVAGIVLMVEIYYTNFDVDTPDFREGPLRYSYTITRIERAEFRQEEDIYLNATHKLINHRSGVNIIIAQSAQIGRFSFQQAFVQLASALGLGAIAGTAVEFLMLYLLPLKNWYRSYKYDEFKGIKSIAASKRNLLKSESSLQHESSFRDSAVATTKKKTLHIDTNAEDERRLSAVKIIPEHEDALVAQYSAFVSPTSGDSQQKLSFRKVSSRKPSES